MADPNRKYPSHPDQGKDVLYAMYDATASENSLVPGKILKRGWVGDRVDVLLFTIEGTSYQLGVRLVDDVPGFDDSVAQNTCWIAPWCR